ncbi:MAG TPA: LysM peptidoglycan-binding domain-containing protein, partial [bacterium]|nr:LysM peptidoglycan-binding domain-containing protein [bacterium]
NTATVAGLGLALRWMPFDNQTGLRPYVELNGGWALSHSATGAAPKPGDSYQGGGAVGILWPLGSLPLELDTYAGGQYIGPHGQALHAISAGLGLSWRFGPGLHAAQDTELGIKGIPDEELAVVGGGWKGSIQFRGNGDATNIREWTLELRDSHDNLLRTLHGHGPLPDAVDLRDVKPGAQAYHFKMTVGTDAGLMYDRSGEIGKALPESAGSGLAEGGAAAQVMVKDGDSLWMISADRQVYGDPMLYYLIIDANKRNLKDPDHLKPGQTLKIEHDVTKRARVSALKRAWATKEQQARDQAAADAASGSATASSAAQ